MKKHLSIRVAGHVQGVFFRASAADKAKELGINGFVRNEPDGSVYMEAEGEESNLQRLIVWANTGPPRAKVTSCEVQESALKNFVDFKILR